MRLAKYILSYLLGTVDMRICYDRTKGEGLFRYNDSSLGDHTNDHHSTSGYIFLLANGAVSWSLCKQKTIAQNTTEAEYMGMTDVANQAIWYRGFLSKLGYSVDDPIPIRKKKLILFTLIPSYFLLIPRIRGISCNKL